MRGLQRHARTRPGQHADTRTALLAAWVSAQPHRDTDNEADRVAGRAEARLRDLHPDAMTRYDQLRAGLSPVEAMREVVPLIVTAQQHAAAREAFAPMLEPAFAAAADSRQALAAWTAALPLADTLPDAALAAMAAESRLRELHPDAMDRYDGCGTPTRQPQPSTRSAPSLTRPCSASPPASTTSRP